MAQTQAPVAVLGIGAMGHGMAASALRAGIPTIVWNRRPEATRDLVELGAEVAETAADAARRAAIVVTMVTDPDAVDRSARPGEGGRQGGPVRHAQPADRVVADGGLAASDAGEVVAALGDVEEGRRL